MFKQSVPVLPVLDIPQRAQWYADHFGFEYTLYPDYAVMTKEGFSLHLWLCSDKYLCENSSCYVYVDAVDVLYTQCNQKGIVHPNGHLKNQPWGLREFSVLDPDGNLLKFGQLL